MQYDLFAETEQREIALARMDAMQNAVKVAPE